MLDHCANTSGFRLKQMRFLVLDECDKMLDMDFEEDIHAILKKMVRNRVNLLFSATYGGKI